METLNTSGWDFKFQDDKLIILAWDKCPPLIEFTKLPSGGEGLCAIDVTTGGHSCEWGGILEAWQVPKSSQNSSTFSWFLWF